MESASWQFQIDATQTRPRTTAQLMDVDSRLVANLTGVRQYKYPQHYAGACRQISDNRLMKSRTEYVRQESVKETRNQIAIHKHFNRLVDEWIDLSIEH
jgi:hypothetical protein